MPLLRSTASLFLTLVLAAVCALGTPVEGQAQISEKVNDVTGLRRLMSDDLRDLAIDTYVGYDAALATMCLVGDTPGEAEYAMAVYGFTTERTALSSAAEATVTADGDPVSVLRVEASERQYDDGDYLELARLYFSEESYAALAYADVVRISLGGAIFVADRSVREDMRLVLARLGI